MSKNSIITSGFMRLLAKFGADRAGQVALTFGLAAVPLVGAAGMGLDMVRKIEAQSVAQAALDGAAMAATAALNSGENQAAYEKAAQDFFDRNKPDNLTGSPAVAVTVDYASGTLSAKTDAAIYTTMTKILGFETLTLTSENSGDGTVSTGLDATVSLPSFTREHKGEIVMVMDYSGSMNWYLGGERKYVTMRNEAAKLVSALSQAKTNEYVKFGVVPFSSEVYTTMPKKYWHGYTGEEARSSCTRDRNYPYNLSDATPLQPNDATHATRFGKVVPSTDWVEQNGQWVQITLPSDDPNSYYFYQGWENYRNNCNSYSGSRNLVIQDLTQNHNDTYNKILSMSPYGNTHIAVGMEFGYHLLSPEAPFTSGVSYSDSGTEKAVILLTDGAQTTRAFGPSSQYSVNEGRKNLETLCSNMKASGIRILTVSYDLQDADTETRLKNCATSIQDFYDADTKSELVAAFNGITAKLAKDMFLAK